MTDDTIRAVTSRSRLVAPITARAPVFDPIKAGVAAVILLSPLVALAATDADGQAVLWENAHWTIAALAAVMIALAGARGAQGPTRDVRLLGAAGAASYLIGQLTWDLQVAAGIFLVPAPSDVFYLGMGVPVAAGMLVHARRIVPTGELSAVALDGLTILAAVAATVLFAFEPVAAGAAPGVRVVLLGYPIVFLGITGFASLIVGMIGGRSSALGPGLIGVGVGLNGLVWAVWIAAAIAEAPPVGTPLNAVSSVGVVMAGVGVAMWRVDDHSDRRVGRIATSAAQAVLPGLGVLIAAIILIAHTRDEATSGLHPIDLMAWATIALATARQTLLLRERTGFIAAERHALERERSLRAEAQRALAAETASETRYRRVVELFARFGEQLTFAAEEGHMLAAAAAALRALDAGVSGDILLHNPSRDRLVVGLAWGDDARAVGDVPALASPLACPGLRRNGPYLVDDIRDPLAVPCPAAAAGRGAVLCVPMISHGEPVGVIHLASTEPIGSDFQEHAVRIAEQLALAVANARLVRSMQDLALTDGLTGLYNARFLEAFLERELAQAERERRSLGVVMIDLDRFKDFNDQYGHPAGDDALRSFATVASGCLRRSDTLARYGGEEFTLVIQDADLAATARVAEKVRRAIEAMTVELRGDRTARLTASFGVATSAVHGLDRRALVHAADEALYRAKRQGGNRVEIAPVQG